MATYVSVTHRNVHMCMCVGLHVDASLFAHGDLIVVKTWM